MESTQFATIILRVAGFLCVVSGFGLVLIRGINAIGRIPWSYIGSFVREALVTPLVMIVIGGMLFGFARRLGAWLAES